MIRLDRNLDSLRVIYAKRPEGWRLLLEHKPYEPAFDSTILDDRGTGHYCLGGFHFNDSNTEISISMGGR